MKKFILPYHLVLGIIILIISVQNSNGQDKKVFFEVDFGLNQILNGDRLSFLNPKNPQTVTLYNNVMPSISFNFNYQITKNIIGSMGIELNNFVSHFTVFSATSSYFPTDENNSYFRSKSIGFPFSLSWRFLEDQNLRIGIGLNSLISYNQTRGPDIETLDSHAKILDKKIGFSPYLYIKCKALNLNKSSISISTYSMLYPLNLDVLKYQYGFGTRIGYTF